MIRARFVLGLSAVVCTLAYEECTYEENSQQGQTKRHTRKTTYCETTCCGTFEEPKCCPDNDDKTMNPWMIFAFAIIGILVISAIVVAVFVIIKKKNKAKAQVETEADLYDEPSHLRQHEQHGSRVDMSVFSTIGDKENPPRYSETTDVNNEPETSDLRFHNPESIPPPPYSLARGNTILYT